MGKKNRKARPFQRRTTEVQNNRKSIQALIDKRPDEIRLVAMAFDALWREAETKGLDAHDAMDQAVDGIIDNEALSPSVKNMLPQFRTMKGPVERDERDVPLRERATGSLVVLLDYLYGEGDPILVAAETTAELPA